MWLGPMIVYRLGSNAFWLIAGLSNLGAGGLYAALSGPGGIPAIGASGVLFGFLGTVALWEMCDQWIRAKNFMPLLQHSIALLSINMALTLANSSAIAWEAHLGGFIAGVLCGRATWKEGIPVYAKDGAAAFETWLKDRGVKNIQALNQVLEKNGVVAGIKNWGEQVPNPKPRTLNLEPWRSLRT